MTQQELDMQYIPPKLAAQAMATPLRTIYEWINTGELQEKRTLSGRRWVLVGSCRALIRKRAGDNPEFEAHFDRILREVELPKSPFTSSDGRTPVLCS